MNDDNLSSAHQFNTKIVDKLVFPPLKNRKGKERPYNITIPIYEINSKIFHEPVIITSDLHENTLKVMQIVDQRYGLKNFNVITAGDMAGLGIAGSDSNPIESYKYIVEKAKTFFFVQGNHDLPDPDHLDKKLVNKISIKCNIDGKIVNTSLGKIVGINGIMSEKFHPYKIPSSRYLDLVEKLLRGKKRVDIFITHETPAINDELTLFKGNSKLFEYINKFKPRIHIYGHCYHKFPIKLVNGVKYISADGKVLIFQA
ncbi:MAG: metallophosphoesterase family protein [Candidatus Hodarchaeales archaeon]